MPSIDATPTAEDDSTLASETLGVEPHSHAAPFVARLELGGLIDRHLLAHGRFALAQVRWADGETAAALELAQLAVEGFASSESTRAQQQKAQAWVDERALLPSHPASP